MTRIAFLLCTLAILAATPARADESTRAVMVELFTAQGCNACPPADAYLSELADRPGVIALSMHVDYWDYLGWRDRFARKACVTRQQAYRDALGLRMVYTPQMVVQGRAEAVGSDRAAVEGLIAAARDGARTATVAIEAREGRLAGIVRPGGTADTTGGTLWVAHYAREQSVAITRGENAGQTMTYRNVVTALMPLADWNGRSTLEIALPRPGPGEGLALWVQGGPGGPIRAAAARRP